MVHYYCWRIIKGQEINRIVRIAYERSYLPLRRKNNWRNRTRYRGARKTARNEHSWLHRGGLQKTRGSSTDGRDANQNHRRKQDSLKLTTIIHRGELLW